MKKIALLLLALLLGGLVGCHKEDAYIATASTTQPVDYTAMADKIGTTGNHLNGTTSGNLIMGLGSFAYSDGYIYFSDFNMIYEYSLESGLTVEMPVEGDGWPPMHLCVVGDKLMFSGEQGIEMLTLDGKEHSVLHDDISGWNVYIDGKDCYYQEYIDENLYHKDLTTGEVTSYFTHVNTFFVTEDSIYVCADDDTRTTRRLCLYKASREDMVFELIETEKRPISVCVNGDDIFYARSGVDKWYIFHIADGVETQLPIRGFYFQSIGDQIIYIDQDSSALKSYNWKTEEEAQLAESALRFCILEDRYVCLQTGSGEDFLMIDLYTGTTTDMLPEPEE